MARSKCRAMETGHKEVSSQYFLEKEDGTSGFLKAPGAEATAAAAAGGIPPCRYLLQDYGCKDACIFPCCAYRDRALKGTRTESDGGILCSRLQPCHH